MAIFSSKTNNNSEDKFFCLSGDEDYIDEDGMPRLYNDSTSSVVAKIVFSKKPKHFTESKQTHPRYYIKLDPNSKIFNPKKILSSIEEKNSLDFLNKVCKNTWEFKEVTPQVFQKYLMFLKTQNLSWLKDAQRDLK